MISPSIFASVLALAVAVSVALAWIISSRHTLELKLQLGTLANSLQTLATRIAANEQAVSALKSTAPTTLAAEVAELGAAVAKLAKTQQRFAGSVYGHRGGRGHTAPNGAKGAPLDIDDPELEAELALQTAAPVAPGRQ